MRTAFMRAAAFLLSAGTFDGGGAIPNRTITPVDNPGGKPVGDDA
jgi:hypothetical protein